MTRKYFYPSISLFFLLCLVASCTSYKKLRYIQDAEALTQEQIQSSALKYEAKIMPNDILSITVNSKTKGIVQDFNLSLLPNGSDAVVLKQYTGASGATGTLQNYIVDKNGNIDFPVLGVVSVLGLTRLELEEKLENLIFPQYINEQPIVNVRFLSFKVSVLGEVVKPGVYSSENGVMTLFDALAMAGDLTIHGKRNNLTLLRENEKGEVNVFKINLQDKNILLNKDLYYLQQNDKIIVEVNRAKGNSSSIGSLESISLSVASTVITIVALIITTVK